MSKVSTVVQLEDAEIKSVLIAHAKSLAGLNGNAGGSVIDVTFEKEGDRVVAKASIEFTKTAGPKI